MQMAAHVNGRVYRAEWKDDLASASSWSALPGEVVGTGEPAEVMDAAAGAKGMRFYRVRLLR